jgi:hypothetical protein
MLLSDQRGVALCPLVTLGGGESPGDTVLASGYLRLLFLVPRFIGEVHCSSGGHGSPLRRRGFPKLSLSLP